MKLRRVLLSGALALSFVVSTPAVAKADPITAAVVSFVGFTGTAAAVATFVINTALTYAATTALGKVSQALSGKNKAALQERQASVLQLSVGEVPREFVFGVCATGGSLDDGFNWGGQHGTDYVTRCISLADHAIEALYEVIVDDVGQLFTGNGVQPGYSGALTVDFFNATAEGSPPPAYVIEASGGAWSEDDRHVGMAHVWVTYKADETIWTKGQPEFKFQLRGMRVYDPRKDAALGYAGPNPHVWEDRSTHEYDANAALVRYAFQRGIYVEGHQGDPEYLLLGRGLSADEAPPERIIAAANLCAEPITEGGGGANIRYKAGGVIRASDDFILVEEMFAAAMAGVIVQREGGVEVEPGHAKAAVVTITDGDLVRGEPIGFSEFLTDADGGRINTVIPRFISPAQNWRDHSGPMRRDLADIAEDGGPRETTLQLGLVYEADQADRCAEIARRMGRLERRASLVLPPDYSWLEEGDWIAWQSDLKHGGATRRYRIESWSLDEKWRMRLSLREIASSVFGVPDPIEDTAEPPPPPVPVDALTLPGASAEAIQLAGEASVIPAVRFHWDAPVDLAIRAIRGEVRAVGETEVSPTRFEGGALAEGVGIATNGVAAGRTLEARLVPIGEPSRPVLPSNWFTVTTGELVAGDTNSLGGRRAAELLAFFREVAGTQAETDRAAEALIQSALDDFSRVRVEAATRRTAIAEVNETVETVQTELGASILSVTTQVVAVGVALAGVQTEVSTVATNLSAETSTRTTQVSALGTNIAAVQSSVTTVANGLSAEVTAREALAASTSSGLASISTSLTALSSTDTVQAGLITTAQTTANGAISSATFAISALNGNQAYLAMLTDVGGRITGQRINGASGVVDFLADYFNITAGSGGGVAIDGAAGRLKVFDGTSKTVLKASGSIRFWSGSASVGDGSETAENGVIALGPGVSAGGRFNGRVLTVPFDSGTPSASIIGLSSSWTNVRNVSVLAVAGGAFQLTTLDLDLSGDATPDGEGVRDYAIQWQLVSVKADNSEQETIATGTFGGQLGPGQPVAFVSTSQFDWAFHAATQGGERVLYLQARFNPGSATTTASVRNVRLRGWAVAGGS